MNENEIGKLVINASMKIHTALGAGLLEGIYETCLAYELEKRGLLVKRQAALPIVYEDLELDNAFRIDILVNDKVVVELKAIDNLLPVGDLLNFNGVHMKDGLKRMVNGL